MEATIPGVVAAKYTEGFLATDFTDNADFYHEEHEAWQSNTRRLLVIASQEKQRFSAVWQSAYA